MNDQQTLRDDLAAIRALMADSQALVHGTWWYQLLWGFLVTLGLVLTWFGEQSGRYGLIAVGWMGVVVVGWTASMIRGRREATEARVQNAASRAFSGIWIGLGVTLTLVGMVSIPTGAVAPDGLPGLLAIVLGAGYFATGFVSGLRGLIFVGVGWWVGGGALLFLQGPNAILGLAALTMLLEIVPALVLRRMEGPGDHGD